MINTLFLLVLTILFSSCATTNKMTNEAIHYAIVGQNEMTLYKRLGVPARTILAPDGGKIWMYEYYSKDMYTPPHKSNLTSTHAEALNSRNSTPGITIRTGVNTETNTPKYIIHSTNVTYLKVYLDKAGKCVGFEQSLPQEQLEIYHERFKHYIPKD